MISRSVPASRLLKSKKCLTIAARLDISEKHIPHFWLIGDLRYGYVPKSEESIV
jgi:hypothetical protein